MAKEALEHRILTGSINVTCKFEDGSVRIWSADKATVVSFIRQTVARYEKDDYKLTLRQLHYQLVSHFPGYVNHDSAYKKLGSILDDCRYAGAIDWDAIEDRGRRAVIPFHADNLAHAIKLLKLQYRKDRQIGQTTYVELWSEKDALSAILHRSTQKYHINLVINKGYTSSSAVHVAYKRIAAKIAQGIKVKILYFGDHDPSGLDMIRDINDRLLLFISRGDSIGYGSDYYDKIDDWWINSKHNNNVYTMATQGLLSNKTMKKFEQDMWDDSCDLEFDAAKVICYLQYHDLFEVVAIGLTMEQIEDYDLPPNPTKLTDKRSDAYIRQYGHQCWEVDGLSPNTLTNIIEMHVEKYIDMGLYERRIADELEDTNKLQGYIDALEKETK